MACGWTNGKIGAENASHTREHEDSTPSGNRINLTQKLTSLDTSFLSASSRFGDTQIISTADLSK